MLAIALMLFAPIMPRAGIAAQPGEEGDLPAPSGGKNTHWQMWPGAGAPADESGRSSHAWVAVPTLDGRDGRDPWRLIHITPRRTLGADGIAHGSDDGVLRASVSLASRPLAIAAVDNVAYVMFAVPQSADRRSREIVSVTAIGTGVADLWTDEPAGAATPEPPLPGTGFLRGFVGTPLGPAALMVSEGAPLLVVLRRGEWMDVPLTPELIVDTRRVQQSSVRLLQSDDGIIITGVYADGGVVVWRGALREEPIESTANVSPSTDAAASPSAAQRGIWKSSRERWLRGTRPPDKATHVVVDWSSSRLQLPAELIDERLMATLRMVRTGGQFVTAHRTADGDVLLGALEQDGWRSLHKVAHVPPDYALAPIDGMGRVALVWSVEDPGPQDTGSALLSRRTMTTHLEVREVSAWTGRLLFAGPALRAGLVGATEFRLLAVAMLLLMAVVLVLILRRDADDDVVVLPPGVALCEPGRRAMAGVLDVLLVFAVATRLVGTSPLAFFSPGVLLSGTSVSAVLLTALLGVVLGTLTEAMFARSPGKLFLGCEVMALARASTARRGFWNALGRSALRNLIKWGLPPLGVFGVLDAGGRHRGDQIAGTVVVVRFEEEEDTDAQD